MHKARCMKLVWGYEVQIGLPTLCVLVALPWTHAPHGCCYKTTKARYPSVCHEFHLADPTWLSSVVVAFHFIFEKNYLRLVLHFIYFSWRKNKYPRKLHKCEESGILDKKNRMVVLHLNEWGKYIQIIYCICQGTNHTAQRLILYILLQSR